MLGLKSYKIKIGNTIMCTSDVIINFEIWIRIEMSSIMILGDFSYSFASSGTLNKYIMNFGIECWLKNYLLYA